MCVVMDTVAMDMIYRITMETLGPARPGSDDSSCYTTQDDLTGSVQIVVQVF